MRALPDRPLADVEQLRVLALAPALPVGPLLAAGAPGKDTKTDVSLGEARGWDYGPSGIYQHRIIADEAPAPAETAALHGHLPPPAAPPPGLPEAPTAPPAAAADKLPVQPQLALPPPALSGLLVVAPETEGKQTRGSLPEQEGLQHPRAGREAAPGRVAARPAWSTHPHHQLLLPERLMRPTYKISKRIGPVVW